MPHQPSPLPPLRFSLRTLLGTVTLFAIGFGICAWLSATAAVAFVLTSLLVAAHVFGNAVGTRLRNGPASQANDPLPIDPHEAEAPLPQTPATPLSQRWSLGWGLTFATAAGIIGGMVGGCLWMEQVYHLGFDPASLILAGAGFGMLGGFASFALASFSQVLAVALLQAERHR